MSLFPPACAIVLSFCVAVASAAEPSKPNILLIVADDLGFSDLGCYGGEIETPNLDRLAAGGVRFTQFYNAGRCWPSRAAIVTGYYSRQTNNDPVKKERGHPAWAAGIPTYLRTAGYRSYHSGKWHFSSLTPQTAGFDRDYTDTSWDDHFARGKPHSSVRIADAILRFLAEHRAKHPGEPFFAMVDFLAPHFPLHAEEADIAKFRERYRVGWEEVRRERYERAKAMGIVTHDLPEIEFGLKPGYVGGDPAAVFGELEPAETVRWDDLSPEAKAFQAEKMAIHAAMVHQMDREIGRVLGDLEAAGELANTVVLFLSDNGADSSLVLRGGKHDPSARPGSSESYLCLGPGWAAASNSPFRRHKIFQHEGGVATPMIVSWPAGNLPAGGLRREPGHVVDFLPTFLELAGLRGDPLGAVEGKPPFSGRSLVPAFGREGAIERDAIYFDHAGERALRKGDWKIVSAKEAPTKWRLYNLAEDRGETRDRAGAEPERVASMRAQWDAMKRDFDAAK